MQEDKPENALDKAPNLLPKERSCSMQAFHSNFWTSLSQISNPKDSYNMTFFYTYGAFTLDFKSVLNENLGGILDGTQC
jgi:hypothetical protein